MAVSLGTDRKIPDYLLSRIDGSTRDVIYKAVEEWDNIEIHDKVIDILNDLFVLTASDDGLKIWEAFYRKKPYSMPPTEWRQLVYLLNTTVINGPTVSNIEALLGFFDSGATLTLVESSVIYSEDTDFTDLSSETTIVSEQSTISSDATGTWDDEFFLLRADTKIYKISDFQERIDGYAQLLFDLLNKVLPANVRVVIEEFESQLSSTDITSDTEASTPPSAISDNYMVATFQLPWLSRGGLPIFALYDWEAQTYIQETIITVPSASGMSLLQADLINNNALLALWYKKLDGKLRIYLYNTSTGYHEILMDNVHVYSMNAAAHAWLKHGLVLHDAATETVRVALYKPKSVYGSDGTVTAVKSGEYTGVTSQLNSGETIKALAPRKWNQGTQAETVMFVTSSSRVFSATPWPDQVSSPAPTLKFNNTDSTTALSTLINRVPKFFAPTDDCLVAVNPYFGSYPNRNRIVVLSETAGTINPALTVDGLAKGIDLPLVFMKDRMIIQSGYRSPDDIHAPKVPYKSSIPFTSFGTKIVTLDKDYYYPIEVANSSKSFAVANGTASGLRVAIHRNFLTEVLRKEGADTTDMDTYSVETRLLPPLLQSNGAGNVLKIYRV